ncbi:MAG: IS481 family transposase [Candidatus Brocadiia bacterium]
MPWKTKGIEGEREGFVAIAACAEVNISELCRMYGISRKIGYKWYNRFLKYGKPGLRNRSRKPKTSPLQIGSDIVIRIVKLRGEHPRWGPKKLRAYLLKDGCPIEEVPSRGTIARMLKRAGLSEPKHRGRPRKNQPADEITQPQEPNDIWTVDFKGWWRTMDGKRCEPLTVRDLYSRYILCLKPMARRNTEVTKAVFEGLFTKFGLPKRIRCDNGSPFASMSGPQGLTQLSAWWRWLGIELERIQPGHPEQNGAHERMHLDIALEIEGQPGMTIEEEEKRLEEWRTEYNTIRPHEGIGQRRPADLYQISRRRLGDAVPTHYQDCPEIRRVGNGGKIKLDGVGRFISEALTKYDVKLKPVSCDLVEVWFCNLCLGVLDRTQVTPLQPTASSPSPAHQNVLPM